METRRECCAPFFAHQLMPPKSRSSGGISRPLDCYFSLKENVITTSNKRKQSKEDAGHYTTKRARRRNGAALRDVLPTVTNGVLAIDLTADTDAEEEVIHASLARQQAKGKSVSSATSATPVPKPKLNKPPSKPVSKSSPTPEARNGLLRRTRYSLRSGAIPRGPQTRNLAFTDASSASTIKTRYRNNNTNAGVYSDELVPSSQSPQSSPVNASPCWLGERSITMRSTAKRASAQAGETQSVDVVPSSQTQEIKFWQVTEPRPQIRWGNLANDEIIPSSQNTSCTPRGSQSQSNSLEIEEIVAGSQSQMETGLLPSITASQLFKKFDMTLGRRVGDVAYDEDISVLNIYAEEVVLSPEDECDGITGTPLEKSQNLVDNTHFGSIYLIETQTQPIPESFQDKATLSQLFPESCIEAPACISSHTVTRCMIDDNQMDHIADETVRIHHEIDVPPLVRGIMASQTQSQETYNSPIQTMRDEDEESSQGDTTHIYHQRSPPPATRATTPILSLYQSSQTQSQSPTQMLGLGFGGSYLDETPINEMQSWHGIDQLDSDEFDLPPGIKEFEEMMDRAGDGSFPAYFPDELRNH